MATLAVDLVGWGAPDEATALGNALHLLHALPDPLEAARDEARRAARALEAANTRLAAKDALLAEQAGDTRRDQAHIVAQQLVIAGLRRHNGTLLAWVISLGLGDAALLGALVVAWRMTMGG